VTQFPAAESENTDAARACRVVRFTLDDDGGDR
jgi:hypothetical protein